MQSAGPYIPVLLSSFTEIYKPDKIPYFCMFYAVTTISQYQKSPLVPSLNPLKRNMKFR